jgi:hypothetical protein
MARSGKKVMQFLSEGCYVANVVEGKVNFYGRRLGTSRRGTAQFRMGLDKIGGRMWMLKGILLGLGVLFIGSLIYVGSKLRPIEEHKATGISAILAVTVANPWWWIAPVATLTLASWFFGSYFESLTWGRIGWAKPPQ